MWINAKKTLNCLAFSLDYNAPHRGVDHWWIDCEKKYSQKDLKPRRLICHKSNFGVIVILLSRFSSVTTYGYCNDFMLITASSGNAHTMDKIWNIIPCAAFFVAWVFARSVSTWLLVAISLLFSLHSFLFHFFNVYIKFVVYDYHVNSGTWKFSLLIHTSKIKVESYLKETSI